MPQFTQTPLSTPTVVTGTAQGDVLAGHDGNDTLRGGDGDDLIFEGRAVWEGPAASGFQPGTAYGFGFGDDLIQGGAGNDTLSYAGSTIALTVDLTQAIGGASVRRGTETDRFTGIETLELSRAGDVVRGAGTVRSLLMGEGADTLVGLSRGLVADGGTGRDTLDLRDVSQTLSVAVDLGTGAASLGAVLRGFEVVLGSIILSNRLTGGAGAEVLQGGLAGDLLRGQDGADTLHGLSGNDTIFGGAGNDRITFVAGGDVIDGGDGDDVIEADPVSDGSGGRLSGGAGNDRVTGASDRERLDGGAGNDSLASYGTDATLFGGSGDDDLFVGSQEGGRAEGGADHDTLRGFLGDDTLLGGTGDDSITADGGNDVLNGGLGMDTLRGGAGDDILTDPDGGTLFGGDGNDTITARTAEVLGGAGDDVITGRGYGLLQGEDGNDTISADAAGGSVLLGGAGDDVLTLTGPETVGLTSLVFGGDGTDSFHFSGRILELRSSVLFGGGGAGVHDDVEVITTDGQTIDLTIREGVSGRAITLGGALSSAWILGEGNTVTFTSGGNIASIQGASNTVIMAGGGDSVVVAGLAHLARVETAGGADFVNMLNGSATILAGTGDDTIQAAAFDGMMTGAVLAGGGHDEVNVIGNLGSVDLGAGNDVLAFGQDARLLEATLGLGADVIDLHPFGAGAIVEVTDFDVARDRIQREGVTGLSSVDSIADVGAGVRLLFRSDAPGAAPTDHVQLILLNLTAADLTDAIFL